MCDYWKSGSKHWCDMCKVWMNDNKPCILTHENGMQHRENVKRKISEASKKSVNDEREKARTEGLLKKMDSGALESAIADIAVNPDLAPQYGIEFTPEVRQAIEDYRRRHPGLALGQASKGALAAARSGFTTDSSIGPTDPAASQPAPPTKPAAGPYKADAKIKLRKQVALPGAAPTAPAAKSTYSAAPAIVSPFASAAAPAIASPFASAAAPAIASPFASAAAPAIASPFASAAAPAIASPFASAAAPAIVSPVASAAAPAIVSPVASTASTSTVSTTSTETVSAAAALPVAQESSSDAASVATSVEASSKPPATVTATKHVKEAPVVAPAAPAAPLLPPLPRWQLVVPQTESSSESAPVDLQLPAARKDQKERERMEELHRLAVKEDVRIGKKRSLDSTADGDGEAAGTQAVVFKKIAQPSESRAFRKNFK